MEIPDPGRFGLESWFPVQETILEEIEVDKFCAFLAYAGAGKTIVALAAAEAWAEKAGASGYYNDSPVILYVTPYRALCKQVYDTISARIPDASVILSIGGLDPIPAASGKTYIVCTPEMALHFFSSLYTDSQYWRNDSLYVILDEYHLILDPERGWMYQALAHSIPNRHAGLAMTATGNETLFKHLDRQYTKVLTEHLQGGRPYERLVRYPELRMDEAIPGIVGGHIAKHEPGLIFVASKRYGYELCDRLALKPPYPTVRFHNADLSIAERESIEEMFAEGEIDVLIHTTTLVAGIDFDVSWGIIAQTSTQNHLVPLYDIVQAASRVGRKRDGIVYMEYLHSRDPRVEHLIRSVLTSNYGDQYIDDRPPHIQSLIDEWAAYLLMPRRHMKPHMGRASSLTNDEFGRGFLAETAEHAKYECRFTDLSLSDYLGQWGPRRLIAFISRILNGYVSEVGYIVDSGYDWLTYPADVSNQVEAALLYEYYRVSGDTDGYITPIPRERAAYRTLAQKLLRIIYLCCDLDLFGPISKTWPDEKRSRDS